MTPSAEDFAAFVTAVHGQAPFPWQIDLLRRVEAEGWPAIVRAPTGAGKTMALDIAVWRLATADGDAPRRVFWVIDRRLVTDQVHDRALRLAEALRAPETEIVRRVAAGLSRLDPMAAEPLAVRLWRGGMPYDDSAPLSPAQACVIVSTVDQAGSRLLFRGYGVSPAMAPVHAGLVGMDSLILLDEAHLSHPFAGVVDAVGRLQAAPWCSEPLAVPRPARLVRLTATTADTGEPLIGPADLADRVLGPRLRAAKPARLLEVKGNELVGAVAGQAASFLDDPAIRRVGAVLNTVASAREVHRRLRALGVDAVLLTGRMRPFDRDRVWREWAPRLTADPKRVATTETPCVIVATQAIEVGVDLDLDALVSEAAPLTALVQRFGRLDRLGRRGSSPAVLVCPTERLRAKPLADPVYGEALVLTWRWLQERAKPVADFAGTALAGVTAEEWQALAVPPPLSEPLDAVMAGLFARTLPRPVPDPQPALFLHGRGGEAEVQIVWRADLDEDELKRGGRAAALIAICPPVPAEALSVPLSATRRWLAGEAEPVLADIPSGGEEDRVSGGRPALAWAGPDDSRVVWAAGLTPGMTLVVPATYGGIDPDSCNWTPGSHAAVPDVADAARAEAKRATVLRVHARLLGDAFEPIRDAILDTESGELAEDAFDRLRAFKALPWPLPPDGDLSGWTAVPYKPGTLAGGVILRPPGPDSATPTTEDDASLDGKAVPLFPHLTGVADTARTFAKACGVTGPTAEAIAWAALLHDVGKVEPRFQTMLHGGDRLAAKGDPLAKGRHPTSPAARRRCGLPDGTRHEVWSLALAERIAPPDEARDLALWLIATHHGRGRPLLPDTVIPPLRLNWPGGPVIEAAGDTARMNWPSRFDRLNRRFGPWGLAWLEAVLRLADHRRSAEERAGETSGVSVPPVIGTAIPAPVPHRFALELRGVRGDSLAGFLCGLGTLRLLSLEWPDADVRLAWGDAFPHVAELSAARPLNEETVLDALRPALDRDHLAFPAFAGHKDVAFASGELRAALDQASSDGDETRTAWLRAFATPTGLDRNGDVGITPFVMLGAGQTNFLKAANALHKAVNRDHLRRTLFQTWDYADAGIDSLRWDPEDAREHAYTLHDPSTPAAWKGNEPRRMAGANRLGLAALPCLPMVPTGGRPQATATERKDSVSAFVWPVWLSPADLATACTLLSACGEFYLDGNLVFQSIRAAAGRYPTIQPARPNVR